MPYRKSREKDSGFEVKKKNPIQLGDDSNLDKDFKPIKIGGESTILNLSESTLDINGSLKVNGSAVVTDLTETVALNDLSDVAYSSGDLTITSLDKIIASGDLTFEVGGDFIVHADDADASIKFFTEGNTYSTARILGDSSYSYFYMYEDAGTGLDLFYIRVAATGDTLLTTNNVSGAGGADLELQADGDLTFDCDDASAKAGKIYFQESGATFAQMHQVVSPASSNFRLLEASGASTDDYFNISCIAAGETTISTVDAAGTDAHLNIEPDGHVEFDGCGVGFDLVTPTYNASDTDVDFKTGNKQFVTFGSGNIADLNLKFPATSGNFVLLLKQDGTGSRTVAADGWLAFDSLGNAANGSSTVKFAGGSNPTLTTDANHVDIISFFWDSDNEIAYGVATLDFQF